MPKKKNKHIVIGVVSTMQGTARRNPRPTVIKATVIRLGIYFIPLGYESVDGM
jgi:energy-converting hydrogenase Eha subunit E